MFKKIFLFATIILFACTANAQFFGRLKPLDMPEATQQSFTFPTSVTANDSTFFAFRPIVTAAIGITNGKTTKAMAGTGISFQNLTYNYATGKYWCNYSLSALALAGGSIAPTSTTDIMSYGLMLGVNNNNIGVGLFVTGMKSTAGDKTKYVVGPMFTYNINFNN